MAKRFDGQDEACIVLGGDTAPLPKRDTAPQFSAHICCDEMSLGMEPGFGPGDFVLDGDPLSPSPRGAPNLLPMFIVAKRIDG